MNWMAKDRTAACGGVDGGPWDLRHAGVIELTVPSSKPQFASAAGTPGSITQHRFASGPTLTQPGSQGACPFRHADQTHPAAPTISPSAQTALSPPREKASSCSRTSQAGRSVPSALPPQSVMIPGCCSSSAVHLSSGVGPGGWELDPPYSVGAPHFLS